jgi:hypothetical protein
LGFVFVGTGRSIIIATGRRFTRGFRIMARCDGAGVRLIARNGNDFTTRFPLAVAANITKLPELLRKP